MFYFPINLIKFFVISIIKPTKNNLSNDKVTKQVVEHGLPPTKPTPKTSKTKILPKSPTLSITSSKIQPINLPFYKNDQNFLLNFGKNKRGQNCHYQINNQQLVSSKWGKLISRKTNEQIFVKNLKFDNFVDTNMKKVCFDNVDFQIKKVEWSKSTQTEILELQNFNSNKAFPKFYGAWISKIENVQYAFIATDYEMTNLSTVIDLLQASPDRIFVPEEFIMLLTVNLLDAVCDLEIKNKVFSDIKPSKISIMLSKTDWTNKHVYMKLNDLSSIHTINSKFENFGTENYLSPEKLINFQANQDVLIENFHQGYTIKVDQGNIYKKNENVIHQKEYDLLGETWSIGITLAETINSIHPFKLPGIDGLIRAYVMDDNKIVQVYKSFADKYNKDLHLFLSACTNKTLMNKPFRQQPSKLKNLPFYKRSRAMLEEKIANDKICIFLENLMNPFRNLNLDKVCCDFGMIEDIFKNSTKMAFLRHDKTAQTWLKQLSIKTRQLSTIFKQISSQPIKTQYFISKGNKINNFTDFLFKQTNALPFDTEYNISKNQVFSLIYNKNDKYPNLLYYPSNFQNLKCSKILKPETQLWEFNLSKGKITHYSDNLIPSIILEDDIQVESLWHKITLTRVDFKNKFKLKSFVQIEAENFENVLKFHEDKMKRDGFYLFNRF